MPEEFVRKEVFDARMDRMEALLEKTLMEMKADNEKLRSEVREGINGLRGEMRENIARLETRIEVGNARIDAVNMRIDGVQTTIYWGFAIVAIVLAFLPTIQDWRKMFRTPPRYDGGCGKSYRGSYGAIAAAWRAVVAPPPVDNTFRRSARRPAHADR